MTLMKDATPIARALVEKTKERGAGRGLLGSAAGNVARNVDPTFHPQQYGVRTLREFVEKFVPDLKIVGLSGPDPIYGLVDWQAGLESATPEDFDAWRVWVSPSSPFCLAVSKANGAVRPLDRSQEPPDGSVRIMPAGIHVHRTIAEDFLKELGGEAPPQLQAVLHSPQPDWWRAWESVLRQMRGSDAFRRWLKHRHDGLLAALRGELEAASVSPIAINQALESVVATHRSKRAAAAQSPVGTGSVQPAVTKALPRASLTSNVVNSDVRLSRLVQAIVARMTDEDLRRLNLPLGLVLDALRDRSTNP